MSEAGWVLREFVYAQDYAAALELWRACGPGVSVGRSDGPEEIQKKLERDPDLFLVAEIEGRLVGTVIGGYDGRRGLIYHLAVSPEQRRSGLGSTLMDEIENRLRAKGCLKSYLLVVKGNEAVEEFYQRRGWGPMNVTLLAKELK